jgi:transketolase
MTQTYESVLLDLALSDERFVVLTAENRSAIRSLPEALGPRFIDVGIAEQTLVGAAAGLALRGRIPVAHALASFLTMRPFEFIRTDVGLPQLPVKLVGAVPGLLSEANGPTHQALEDVGLMRAIPGMGVFCPADEEDMLLGLPGVLQSSRPFYVRFNARRPVWRHSSDFVLGRAERVLDGTDVAILTYGTLFSEAYEAAVRLENGGLTVRLVNLRTVKPFDEEAALEAIRSTKLTVTIEDHFLSGGLYTLVAELLLSRRESADVFPIAFEERWFRPGLLPDVLEAEALSAAQIAERIERAWLARRR